MNNNHFIQNMIDRINESKISREHKYDLIGQLQESYTSLQDQNDKLKFESEYLLMVDELIQQYPQSSEILEMMETNNKMDDLITKENEETYTNLILYLRGSNLDEKDQESIRSDLIRMILDAQERGDDLHKVIPQDSKDFMDAIIESFDEKSQQKQWMDNVVLSTIGLSILFGITLIKGFLQNIISGQGLKSTIPITLGDILSIILIVFMSFFIINRLTRNPFKNNSEKFWLMVVIMMVLMFVLVVLLPIILKPVVFSINIFVGIFLAFIIIILAQLLYKKI